MQSTRSTAVLTSIERQELEQNIAAELDDYRKYMAQAQQTENPHLAHMWQAIAQDERRHAERQRALLEWATQSAQRRPAPGPAFGGPGFEWRGAPWPGPIAEPGTAPLPGPGPRLSPVLHPVPVHMPGTVAYPGQAGPWTYAHPADCDCGCRAQ